MKRKYVVCAMLGIVIVSSFFYYEICHRRSQGGFIDHSGNETSPPMLDLGKGYADTLKRLYAENHVSGNFLRKMIDERGHYNVLGGIGPGERKDWYRFSEGLNPERIGDNGYFLDREGNVAIHVTPAVWLESFSDERALVAVTRVPAGGRTFTFRDFGFIDKEGHYVIEPTYDIASSFSDGLAAVCSNWQWGYIDKQGASVIPMHFKRAGAFKDGVAPASDGKWGFIDKQGKFIIQPAYEQALEFSEGLAAVEQNGKWGFINRSGKVVISPQFDFASSFSEGLAAVCVGTQSGLYGYIDESGKFRISPRYVSASPFYEGSAFVWTPTFLQSVHEYWQYVTDTRHSV